jgi:hypothetical protein
MLRTAVVGLLAVPLLFVFEAPRTHLVQSTDVVVHYVHDRR